MKHKKLILSGLAIAVALAGVVGLTQTSLAAGNGNGFGFGHWRGHASSTPMVGGKSTANSAANSAARQAARQKMQAQQTAINTALANDNYSAWVTAVGTSSPLTQKINASNFSQLVQIYQLQQQIKTLETNLGLNQRLMLGAK